MFIKSINLILLKVYLHTYYINLKSLFTLIK